MKSTTKSQKRDSIRQALFPADPIIVEVGSIHGAHGIKLCKKFNNKLTMVAYEAGIENFSSLVEGIGSIKAPFLLYNAAVTGSDGEIEFFEFDEISSNSIYPRHIEEGRHLRRTSRVRSISLETVLRENDCPRIDLLFVSSDTFTIAILSTSR